MPTSQNSTRLLLLQHIRDAGPRIQSRCAPLWTTGQHPPPPETLPIRDFNTTFPYPKPIAPEIESLGLDPNTALELSTAYTRAASRFRCLCENLLRNSYSESDPSDSQDTCSSVLLRLNSAFSEKCQSGLQQWREITLQLSRLAASRNSAIPSHSNKARQVFNQDSVPLLEKYFEYNNYPPAADRVALARKAGLTRRQVEVWFQNHRNRAKKAGKPIKRLRYDEFPREFSLEGLEERLSFKRHSRKQSPGKCSTTSTTEPPAVEPQPTPILYQTRLRGSILDIAKPPPDAFPAPFQPPEPSDVLSLQQFPCHQLEWYRHPAKKLLHRKVPTVDELCESFQSCLNLRKWSKRSHSEAFIEGETPTETWSPATYTTLPPTRHPALVEAKQNCLQLPQLQQLGDSNSLCPSRPRSEPRQYLPLPCRLGAIGFSKYQHQRTKLSELPPTRQNAPRQLRRRSSASSVDSSVGCSTPISSPIAHVHLLSDVFQDTSSCDVLRDPDTLPLSKKLRSQIDPNIYAPCNLVPSLLHSI